jgi:hypothetical protein
MTFVIFFGGLYRPFTGWMVRGLNVGACKTYFLLHTHPDRPWVPPRYRVILGAKAAGLTFTTDPNLGPRLKKADIYLYSASVSAVVCYEVTATFTTSYSGKYRDKKLSNRYLLPKLFHFVINCSF